MAEGLAGRRAWGQGQGRGAMTEGLIRARVGLNSQADQGLSTGCSPPFWTMWTTLCDFSVTWSSILPRWGCVTGPPPDTTKP